MTAEIAILNKSAVAMAADSAVTISAGNRQEKIFDSGDKLFELCHQNPIGIMIYNGMQFMGIPLPILIKDFRDGCKVYKTVREAARAFLSYLNRKGKSSSRELFDRSIESILVPVFEEIAAQFQNEFMSRLQGDDGSFISDDTTIQKVFNDTFESEFSKYEKAFAKLDDAQCVDKKTPIRFTKADITIINKIISSILPPPAVEEFNGRVVEFSKKLLKSNYFSDGRTGIVVAGFGSKETFPTLIAYEIDGMVGKSLKFRRTNFCDIDRGGMRASVIPFAQREMVDRFLYGLDKKIQLDISKFCEESITSISNGIFERISFSNKLNEATLKDDTKKAEEKFVNDLSEKAFSTIVDNSRREIEGMVEFMPKPELAKMAEALIDLTSIKRRVTRGFETVGGPVDVIIISKAEGLVWVKRKHYFPQELNSRYFNRDKQKRSLKSEENNE